MRRIRADATVKKKREKPAPGGPLPPTLSQREKK
jgi:hypothetical protein